MIRENLKLVQIPLKTVCCITSSYFIQDGFFNIVDFMGTLEASGQSSSWLIWKIFDGTLLISLGYMCILGIEKANLNLIRWPTLTLFIYKVIEYCLEHVYGHVMGLRSSPNVLNNLKRKSDLKCLDVRHAEWTGHFLIPAIHLSVTSLFLWRYVKSSAFLETAVRFTVKKINRKKALIRNRTRALRSPPDEDNDQMRLLDMSNGNTSE